jgi:hypothetical protein
MKEPSRITGFGHFGTLLVKIPCPLSFVETAEQWRKFGWTGHADGMVGSWPPQDLPNLTDAVCEVKSPYDTNYNCIAFAAGDNQKWWWPTPDDFWPDNVSREVTFDAFVQAFETKGFARCQDGTLDQALGKVALFGKDRGDGQMVPTHAAAQLPDGRWASKLGNHEDVHHDTVEAVNSPAYGAVVLYLAKPKVASP